MQHHSLDRFVNQEIQISQRLRISLECGEALRTVSIRSLVRSHEVHAQAAFTDVAGRIAITSGMRNLSKGFIHTLQDVEHGRCLISYSNRDAGELCNVHVTGL